MNKQVIELLASAEEYLSLASYQRDLKRLELAVEDFKFAQAQNAAS